MDKTVAMKFDSQKPRMELLDAVALEGLAKVLTFGANKYAANNWRAGLSYSRVIGAALRHIAAIQRGEDVDPESGLPHIDHLGCCWMFLSNYMNTGRTELDDRYKEPKKEQYDGKVVQGLRSDLGADSYLPGSGLGEYNGAVLRGVGADGRVGGVLGESQKTYPGREAGPPFGSQRIG